MHRSSAECHAPNGGVGLVLFDAPLGGGCLERPWFGALCYALTTAAHPGSAGILSQDVDRSHHLGDGIAIAIPLTGERIDV